MRNNTGETYTPEQAAVNALEWCKNNPGWKRICDIEDSDSLHKTWHELTKKEQWPWIQMYRDRAEEAWLEFGRKPYKVPSGFITGKGEFYSDVLMVPLHHNLMMVFKVC